MQFSLLSLLVGQPQVSAAAGSAAAQEGQQGTDTATTPFSDMLASANPQHGDLSHGKQHAGGDLVQELVANVTVAQEDGQIVPAAHHANAAHIQTILDRKISPEHARDLLAQFDSQSQHEQPPEALKEALEAVESGGEPTSVHDILTHVAAGQPDEMTEQRATTLQRALQWLQQALTANPAPMEALAAMSAGATFPEITIATPERRKETQGAEEVAAVMPQWVQQITARTDKAIQSTETSSAPTAHVVPFVALPEVDLPEVQRAEAASVEQGTITDDALVLVATKQNTPHHPSRAGSKSDVFEAMIAELTKDSPNDVPSEGEVVARLTTDSDATPTNPLAHQPQASSTEQRAHENVRIHHANFAYLRSEVMDQVKVGVTQAVRDGVDRITIQLNPQDLGRVEVKMDIAADGMSQISFLVDKADTFDLLQRDARSLERMLHDAGVRADAGSMEFNLRQESQNKEPWGEAANRNDGESMTTETSTLSATFNPGDLPTQMYVHLVSDRLDITA